MLFCLGNIEKYLSVDVGLTAAAGPGAIFSVIVSKIPKAWKPTAVGEIVCRLTPDLLTRLADKCLPKIHYLPCGSRQIH